MLGTFFGIALYNAESFALLQSTLSILALYGAKFFISQSALQRRVLYNVEYSMGYTPLQYKVPKCPEGA